MKLFVGLGNPGAKYAGNRHNIGFMALDRIAADHGFTPWKARFQGAVAEGRLGTERIVALKPETFMNLSGQSVRAAMDFYKLTPAGIIVFHDELDLAPGRTRVKQGGGHAGHNGLRSIHGHLGDGYGRVRLGIGHPGHKDRVAAFVLQDFAKAEQEDLADLLTGLSEGAPHLGMGDTTRFLNTVALRTAPPRAATGQKMPDRTALSPARDGAPKSQPQELAGKTPDRTSPSPEPARDDAPKSLLQKLAERFR